MEFGGSQNDLLFSTKERDFSTGLDYFGFRYYDAVLGKFTTRDPSGYPDGPNNYLYVNNNPINAIDPLGLESVRDKFGPTPFVDDDGNKYYQEDIIQQMKVEEIKKWNEVWKWAKDQPESMTAKEFKTEFNKIAGGERSPKLERFVKAFLVLYGKTINEASAKYDVPPLLVLNTILAERLNMDTRIGVVDIREDSLERAEIGYKKFQGKNRSSRRSIVNAGVKVTNLTG